VAVYSLRYVAAKKYGRFVLLICTMAFFHKSVLVVIPVYLLAAYVTRKWHYIALVLMGGFFLLGKDIVMKIALILYPSYKNTSYISESTGVISGWIGNASGIGRCILVLGLCLWFYKNAIKNNVANKLYFNLNIFAIMLYIFGVYLPLLSRFTYYLMVPHILLVPNVIESIENAKTKKKVIACVIVIGLLYFVLFMKGAYDAGLRVLPYQSWIFGIKEYLYANEVF
jgi:hypothetical protein